MNPWGLAGMVAVLAMSIGIFWHRHWEDQHPKVTSCYSVLATTPDSSGNFPLVSHCYTERR